MEESGVSNELDAVELRLLPELEATITRCRSVSRPCDELPPLNAEIDKQLRTTRAALQRCESGRAGTHRSGPGCEALQGRLRVLEARLREARAGFFAPAQAETSVSDPSNVSSPEKESSEPTVGRAEPLLAAAEALALDVERIIRETETAVSGCAAGQEAECEVLRALKTDLGAHTTRSDELEGELRSLQASDLSPALKERMERAISELRDLSAESTQLTGLKVGQGKLPASRIQTDAAALPAASDLPSSLSGRSGTLAGMEDRSPRPVGAEARVMGDDPHTGALGSCTDMQARDGPGSALRRDAPSFDVILGEPRQLGGAEIKFRSVSIRLKDAGRGSLILLGEASVDCLTCGGMDPSKIAIHRLPSGDDIHPNLLHIEWAGAAAGARGVDDTAFRIVYEERPDVVVARGTFRPWVRGGAESAAFETTLATCYERGVLTVFERRKVYDHSFARSSEEPLLPIGTTEITRMFEVLPGSVRHASTILQQLTENADLAEKYRADGVWNSTFGNDRAELMTRYDLDPSWEIDEMRFDLPEPISERHFPRLGSPPSEDSHPSVDLAPAPVLSGVPIGERPAPEPSASEEREVLSEKPPRTSISPERVVEVLNTEFGRVCKAELSGWFGRTLKIDWTAETKLLHVGAVFAAVASVKEGLAAAGVRYFQFPNDAGTYNVIDWATGKKSSIDERAPYYFKHQPDQGERLRGEYGGGESESCPPFSSFCTGGTCCPRGSHCCWGQGSCCPDGYQCCIDGRCCPRGTYCSTYGCE